MSCQKMKTLCKDLKYCLECTIKKNLYPFYTSVLFLFIAWWTFAKCVFSTVYSKIFVIRHLQGNRESDSLGKLAT